MLEVSPLRPLVMERSDNQCEAMVVLHSGVATRCGRRGVDDHHMLTRARGGSILDKVGEIYHHLALCRFHHSLVDNYGSQSGLLIEGYVVSGVSGPVYVGPDEYLTKTYGAK